MARGTADNPRNRFERLEVAVEEEFRLESVRTVFFRDDSQSIITTNESPDIGFTASINPYRGCEHGCSYCYARPYHEYLGFSAGLDFESKIMVKPRAAEILREELSAPKWQPKVLAMSGVTDCYQPVERKLGITRSCLQVLQEFRQPVALITKNHLVTRDIDLLAPMAALNIAGVYISMTSLDTDLASKLEPRAARPHHRLEAIRLLAAAGIPVGVAVAPVIPGLNEHEIPALLEQAAAAGARHAAYTVVRLPYGVKEIFAGWLEENYPQRKDKILDRIRDVRGGKLNSSEFGSRMKGEGFWADQVRQIFQVAAARHGFNRSGMNLTTSHFRNPAGEQMRLF